mmetsp:Transcript_44284/g.139699  ORF Transcript_44284/g.139699 Transcript_44284/m.139699 type:complete len:140 (-) Transcript_44284:1419-1838(-)
MSQHSDALEQCYEHLEDSRNSLKTMEKTMNDHDDFFASKRSNLNAQVMNLRAQNEKLVYELSRYQNLGTDNMNLQHSMRRMTTEHDKLRREVSTLQKEVDDLEMMVNSIDTKFDMEFQKCGRNILQLQETYKSRDIRLP